MSQSGARREEREREQQNERGSNRKDGGCCQKRAAMNTPMLENAHAGGIRRDTRGSPGGCSRIIDSTLSIIS